MAEQDATGGGEENQLPPLPPLDTKGAVVLLAITAVGVLAAIGVCAAALATDFPGPVRHSANAAPLTGGEGVSVDANSRTIGLAADPAWTLRRNAQADPAAPLAVPLARGALLTGDAAGFARGSDGDLLSLQGGALTWREITEGKAAQQRPLIASDIVSTQQWWQGVGSHPNTMHFTSQPIDRSQPVVLWNYSILVTTTTGKGSTIGGGNMVLQLGQTLYPPGYEMLYPEPTAPANVATGFGFAKFAFSETHVLAVGVTVPAKNQLQLNAATADGSKFSGIVPFTVALNGVMTLVPVAP